MTPARKDPRGGLGKAERLALLDADRGLLGLINGRWRRQTCQHFDHAPAVVAELVARGHLDLLADDIAQITFRGRFAANRIRSRRAAIEVWDRYRTGLPRGERQCVQAATK